MIRYLMDTDHLTLLEHGHGSVTSRLAAAPSGSVALSVVTVGESLRGRLSAVAAARSAPARIVAFARLASSVRRLSAIPVVDYDADCEVRFDGLRAAGIRIGTPDLRIAATALAKGLTVATRNRRDFGQVSGLVVQDRSAP